MKALKPRYEPPAKRPGRSPNKAAWPNKRERSRFVPLIGLSTARHRGGVGRLWNDHWGLIMVFGKVRLPLCAAGIVVLALVAVSAFASLHRASLSAGTANHCAEWGKRDGADHYTVKNTCSYPISVGYCLTIPSKHSHVLEDSCARRDYMVTIERLRPGRYGHGGLMPLDGDSVTFAACRIPSGKSYGIKSSKTGIEFECY